MMILIPEPKQTGSWANLKKMFHCLDVRIQEGGDANEWPDCCKEEQGY